jgi:oligopeptide transport system substrate-binding protein
MSLVKQWRYLLLTLIAIIALGAVAACGDDDDDDDGGDTPAPSETDGATETAAPSGGEITMQITEPESLDAHFSDFSLDITIIQSISRGLYDLPPGGELVPAYADGLPTVSDDGLTVTVPVKSGMTWADGETLDANDFVFGLQRTCNPDVAGHYQYILTNIAGCDDYYAGDGALEDVGVSAPDANTLEITLNAPQRTFPVLLALWPTYPAPDEALAGDPAAEWPAPPDTPCNGPFCVSEWIVGDHLTLVKNDNWGLGEANLDQINLRIIDDLSTALNAYDAGELDMTRVSATDLPLVQDRDEFHIQALPITIGLEFLMTDDVVGDLNVRLALSRATDRVLLNDVVNEGAYVPTTNWVPSEEPGANANGFVDDIIGFDEAAAQQALADAGYPNGDGFPGVSMLLTDSEGNKILGEFLQEQWSDILGIDLTLDLVDGQTRQERFNDSQFQITTGGWGHDYPDAENWLIGLYETGASINKQMCSMQEIDDLLGDAATETENEAAWALLQEAEKIILENLCGIAPLYHRGNLYLISSNITGVEPTLEDHYYPQFPENWALTQ